MLQDLFEKAKEIFTTPVDQELLEAQRQMAEDLEQVSALRSTPGGKILVKTLVENIESHIREMCKDSDELHIAHVKANLQLLDKLTAGKDLDSIKLWLEEKIKDGD